MIRKLHRNITALAWLAPLALLLTTGCPSEVVDKRDVTDPTLREPDPEPQCDDDDVCGTGCVNLQTDAAHCGACDNACGAGQACIDGACACTEGMCGSGCPAEISGLTESVSGTTVGAENMLEPTCGAPGSGEQAYTFVAPETGSYTFNTRGSSFDTTLYVIGDGCSELACSDDTETLQSQVTVMLGAQQTVLVVVDGFGGEEGNFVLNVNQGYTNASCAPTELGSTSPQSVSGETSGGVDRYQPSCAPSDAPEAVYSFTAPSSGMYRFDTLGSNFDTTLYAHDGQCGSGELACNDDTIGVQSEIVVVLSAGQTITVFLDGYGDSTGSYRLNVDGPM